MRAMLRHLCFVIALALASSFVQQPRYDIVIRNARVMDGAGNPWVRADVAVKDGRIAAFGALPSLEAGRTIDAAGQVLAPGFIDVHSHAAEGLVRSELRQAQPIVAQGVTTIVVNPDGGGPVDLAKQRAQLEENGLGVNLVPLVGHGSVRAAVIGRARRDPDPAELERMQALVRRAMDDGAFGLSSGLFYIPGSFAKIEEVIALARAAGERGGVYTSHIRDEADYSIGVVASVDEVIRVAEEAHVRGIVTHMKALGRANWGKAPTLLQHIDAARSRGIEVFADQYPYDASSTTLQAALLPDGPSGERARDVTTAAANLQRRGGPDAIVIAFCRTDRALEGLKLSKIAADRNATPADVAVDIVEKGGASVVSFNMSANDIDAIMREPYTMSSSDGGLVAMGEGKPHPRNNGAFARKLAAYVRDRHIVSLEFAIRSMTSLPALVFGIKDRGTIREGAWGDLVVFDPATIQDRATYENPHQLATGVSYVLVNGELVIDAGKFTTALPGRVLRKGKD